MTETNSIIGGGGGGGVGWGVGIGGDTEWFALQRAS